MKRAEIEFSVPNPGAASGYVYQQGPGLNEVKNSRLCCHFRHVKLYAVYGAVWVPLQRTETKPSIPTKAQALNPTILLLAFFEILLLDKTIIYYTTLYWLQYIMLYRCFDKPTYQKPTWPKPQDVDY